MTHDPTDLGVFETTPHAPGSGGLMKCPNCQQNTPDAWERFQTYERFKEGKPLAIALPAGVDPDTRQVSVDWMHCANEACGELVIRSNESFTESEGDLPVAHRQESILLRPRFAMSREVAAEVPGDLRRDYLEAARIFPLSPRMSAVLARRILADLLEKYANLTDFSLKVRINEFAKDTNHPHDLRHNLGYLAEVGNFGAHTQTNDQAEIVDVDEEEADWTLNLVDRLFDYFIVSPEKDRKMREALDEKLQAANRKPIDAPPEGESS